MEQVERNFDGDNAILGARIDTIRWVLEDDSIYTDKEMNQDD